MQMSPVQIRRKYHRGEKEKGRKMKCGQEKQRQKPLVDPA